MNIELVAVGTKGPDWVLTGFNEYQKRLPKDWQLNVRELAVSKRHKGEPAEKHIEDEGKRMQSVLNTDGIIVALDSRGTNWSTLDLSKKLSEWQYDYKQVQFLIGGPDGLSKECLSVAREKWSLSRLTFPHFIVRILLAEQLYRAWSVLNNHPYHK